MRKAIPLITGKSMPFVLTLIIALVSGYLFTLIRMPIPWLLGPMIGVWLAGRVMKSVQLYWPGSLRNAGLIAVGYAIGLSFTTATLREIIRQFPSMILLTLLLLLLCALIAYGMSKLTGIPFPTTLTGSIPGGLSQMIALAEETKGIDITVVTFLQASRLMMIVVSVPLLIFSPLMGGVHSELPILPVAEISAGWAALFPDILPFAIACTAFALLGSRVNFPTAYLLAPMLITAALHLSGLPGPGLPSSLVNVAQLMIGCYIGLLLKPETLPNKLRIVSLSVVSGAVLIAGACLLSYLMTRIHDVSAATALLSLSPGGMDQMGIIAHEIEADVSIVTSYQVFRTFFIFFAVPPLLKLLFSKLAKTKKRSSEP